MRTTQRWIIFAYTLVNLAIAGSYARAQGVEVSAHVMVQAKTAAGKHRDAPSSADVVVWLVPFRPDGRPAATGHPGPFRLVQKDKMFTPHLLVVPSGTSVEFPNEDPFFHNVFSLFNGKRFDLGLYESGTSRAGCHFDREGVSYIFCNIHPEMGAVVLALSTPYYGISNCCPVLNMVAIRDVPPGNYRLPCRVERSSRKQPIPLTRRENRADRRRTGPFRDDIILQGVADPMEHHKNKFGDDYRPSHNAPY